MKKAIVLGGTSPHIELIGQLKSRGYYTILIDYLPDAPAIKYADEFIRESTLDKERVLQTAKSLQVDLVISACIDQANSTCCYVAERLGLPHPYSYETSLDVTDKGRMKRKMVNGGVPTSDFQIFHSIDSIDWSKVMFPAVVKPVDCNSSKGVRRVDNVDEAEKWGLDALRLSRTGCAIIEGYNKGREIQVDCLADANKASVIMTREKKHVASMNSVELNSTGSIIPALCCEGRERELEDIAGRISGTFGLCNTPFFYQAIVSDTGDVNVLEFAPRVGGGLSYYLIKELTGFDPVKAVVQSFLGEKIMVRTKAVSRLYSTNFLYMEEGIFDHVTGLDDLKSRDCIKEYFVTKSRGAKITGSMRSGNRVASFVVEGSSVEEVKKKENTAYASVDIIDAYGQSRIRRMGV